MEEVIVAVVVISAAWFVYRTFKKQAKEGSCNCSHSCGPCKGRDAEKK